MPLGSYSQLVTSIGTWTARSDLTTQIDDFIDMAEAEFNRKLRVQDMITISSLTVTSTSAVVTLPTDCQQVDSLAFTTDPSKIDFVSMKQLKDRYGVQATGRPQAYASKTKTTIQFGPPSDASYGMELSYYAKIPALSSSNTTNWLLTKEPELYLFTALHKALGYVVDQDRKAEIEAGYQRVIAEIMEEDEENQSGGAGMAVRSDTGNP